MYHDSLYYPTGHGMPADNDHIPMPEGLLDRDLSSEILDVEVIDRGKGLPLVISFGGFGINPDTGRAQYAMQGFLKDSAVNQICVRDHFCCWYHNGISGASTDVASTVVYLRQLIDELQADRILCTGTSGGGHAAILFGTLLGVTGVIALNPQTLLQRGLKCYAEGHLYTLKWTDGEGTWDFTRNQQYADLLDLPPSDVRIEIIYGQDSLIDEFHSGRMNVLPNVHAEGVPGDHSTAIIRARDNGVLAQLFGDVLTYPIWNEDE